MAVKYILTFFFINCLFWSKVIGKDMSSLTFVIDDTSSMWDDIDEVRAGVNAIFNTVLENKDESQIHNFIILTFNDHGPGNEYRCTYPGVILRANTTDREDFRRGLNEIRPGNGAPGCEECPMAGIEEGIKISLPKSTIYVFTDATAKDHYRYEYVKKLAMEKQSQIVFALTGNCGLSDEQPMLKIYQDVATATKGEVFNIKKGQVNKVLEYVKKTITGRRTTIADSELLPGLRNVTFYADGLMGEVLFSFASTKPNNPSVNVKDSNGRDVKPVTVFSTEKVAVYSVKVENPGLHSVIVNTPEKTHAVISAKSGVDFQHGFSAFNISSIVDTSSRPAPGVKSHLSIKLTEGDIALRAVQIINQDGTVNMELPLHITDNGTKLYTTEEFLPPQTMFTIAIVGYDKNSNTTVTRITPPVEPQKLLPGEVKDKAPSVSIKGGSKVSAIYDGPLNLTCEVEGYPQPEIIWKNLKTGAELAGKILPGKDAFTNFVNVLSLEKVTENATYSCEASHGSQRDYKEITVEVPHRRYLDITTKNENVTVEYEKEIELVCTVDAYPLADITWYRNDEKLIISGDTEITSSSTSSTVTIKKVTLAKEGKYTCEAKNEDTNKTVDLNVTIINLLSPAIVKDDKKEKELVTAKVSTEISIDCKVNGVPPPRVIWYKNNTEITKSSKFRISDDFTLSFVADLTDTGDYICNATNELGTDFKTTELYVTVAPTIVKDDKKKELVTVKTGSKISIECEANGVPPPQVAWFKDNKEITKSSKFQISNDYTISFVAELADAGDYTCNATNELGTDLKTVEVYVTVAPSIVKDDKKKKTVRVKAGSETSLDCKVSGIPPPRVIWLKDNTQITNSSKYRISDDNTLSFIAELLDAADYTCNATNELGTDLKMVEVYVTVAPLIVKDEKKKEKVRVKAGSETSLDCKVSGVPPPHVAWLKDSSVIIKSSKYRISDDHTLRFVADLSDAGDYICNATNDLGTDLKTVELYVTVAPTIVKEDTKKELLTVPIGSKTSVECKVSGVPRPRVAWFKDNKEITKSSKFQISDDYISFVAELSDSGDYICNATNELGTDFKTVEVYVTVAPTIVKDEKKKELVTVKTGSKTSIECEVSGVPPPHVAWLKDNKIITNSSKFQISNDYTISFVAELLDAGDYICNATNDLGSDIKPVEVYVTVAPTVVKDNKKNEVVTVTAGSKASIACEVAGVPPPRVTWQKDKKEITKSSKFKISDDHTLSFIADLKDAGDYICKATNDLGSDLKTVEVSVTVEPSIVKKDKKKEMVTVEAGSKVSVNCEVNGVPPPRVAWFKRNKKITKGSKFQISDDYTLSFVAGLSDAGDYICNATNLLGSDVKTVEVYVTVAPTIVKNDKKKEVVPVKVRTKASIDCKVSGVPPPRVSWFKDNKEIKKSSKFQISKKHTLSFIAELSDAGDYTCNATNKLGTDSKTVEVYVKVKPKIVKHANEKKLITIKGDDTSVACDVTGIPPPTVVWLRENKKITNSTKFTIFNNYTLSFIADLTDSTNYKCTATNELGSDHKAVKVTVQVAPTIVKNDKKKEVVPVKAKTKTKIECNVSGVPPPRVSWFKDNKEIKKSSKFQISKKHTLSFFTELADAGDYTCNATNKLGTDSKTVEVYVKVKPKIDKHVDEKKLIAIKGAITSVACDVTGIPPPTVVWLKENKEITNSTKFTIFNNYTLSFIAELTDSTDYKCTATNELGSDHKAVKVSVKVPATIETPETPLNKTVIVGKFKLKLWCKASGDPEPEISWKYQSFDTRVPPHDVEVKGNKQRLVLRNIKMSDEGNYTCTAQNSYGSWNITHSIYVFEKPDINKTNSADIFAKKGSPVQIDCKITKGKPKPSITWFFKFGENYNDSPERFNEVAEWKDKESIVVKNIGVNNSGIYQCRAENEIEGTKYHKDLEVSLHVEYAPEIKNSKTMEKIKAKVGSEVSIPCFVVGRPTPEVTWLKDGKKLLIDGTSYKFEHQILKFVAKISHRGDYTCRAVNKFDTASMTVAVNVIESPSLIDVPENKNFSVEVGSKVTLPCTSKGDPKPTIRWVYQSFDPRKSDRTVKHEKDNSLQLDNIQVYQEGIYTCFIVNPGGNINVTYIVQVFVPAAIVNTYKEKRFVVVEGDLALHINCKTIGHPKPIVTWTKDDNKLDAGSTYFIESGTLTIANIPENASGYYTCEAMNPRATDNITYEVVVEKSPPRSPPVIPPTYVERDQSAKINCPLPHEDTDLLRWYKDRVLIHTGELSITNTLLQDSGEYTCRVSTNTKSYSKTIEVVVGYAPTFRLRDYEKNITVNDNTTSHLNCEADAIPEGEYAWFYNNNKLIWTEAVYLFPERVGKTGEYRCEVANRFGKISRVFYVTQEYCVIETSKLVLTNTLAPLTLDESLSWPESVKSGSDIKLPKGRKVNWYCPSSFNIHPGRYLTGFCDGGANFKVKNTIQDYSNIRCKEKIEHKIKRTKEICYLPNTELIKIGYDVVESVDTVVYEICFDIKKKLPLFSKQILQKSFADDYFDVNWSDKEHFNINFDEAYNCDAQKRTIMDKSGALYHNEDDCCFGRRHLVSPKDVFPGVPQRSTYSYFNVVPQWSPCDAYEFDNWDEIERRVRNFVKDTGRHLMVWTGIAEHVQIGETPIVISNNPTMFVPLYLWKVVQDPYSNSSLAIIQINTPDLDDDASEYELCTNVCDDTDWMQNGDWYEVTRGYTFCCSITDFEEKFSFRGIFEPAMESILRKTD